MLLDLGLLTLTSPIDMSSSEFDLISSPLSCSSVSGSTSPCTVSSVSMSSGSSFIWSLRSSSLSAKRSSLCLIRLCSSASGMSSSSTAWKLFFVYCKRGYIDEFKIWRFFSKRQLASFNFDEFLNKSKSYLSLISYNARVRVIFLANSFTSVGINKI